MVEKNKAKIMINNTNIIDIKDYIFFRYSLVFNDWDIMFFNNIDICESAKILDIGCGTGNLWLKNRNKIDKCSVYLVDTSNYVNKRIKRMSNFKFYKTTASELPFEEEMFDIIIVKDVVFLLKNIEEAFDEWFRVLKRNGKIYISYSGDNHLKEVYQLLAKYNFQPIYNRCYNLKNSIIKIFIKKNITFSKKVIKDKIIINNANDAFNFIISYAYNDSSSEDKKKSLNYYLKKFIRSNNNISFTKEQIMFICKKNI